MLVPVVVTVAVVHMESEQIRDITCSVHVRTQRGTWTLSFIQPNQTHTLFCVEFLRYILRRTNGSESNTNCRLISVMYYFIILQCQRWKHAHYVRSVSCRKQFFPFFFSLFFLFIRMVQGFWEDAVSICLLCACEVCTGIKVNYCHLGVSHSETIRTKRNSFTQVLVLRKSLLNETVENRCGSVVWVYVCLCASVCCTLQS